MKVLLRCVFLFALRIFHESFLWQANLHIALVMGLLYFLIHYREVAERYIMANIRWATPLAGYCRVPIVHEQGIGIGFYEHSSYTSYFTLLDPQTGSLIWKHQLPGTAYAEAACDHRRFYVPCGPTRLTALDAATGEEHWQYEAGARIRSSPQLIDGKLDLAIANQVVELTTGGYAERTWQRQGAFFFGNIVAVGPYLAAVFSQNPEHSTPHHRLCVLDRHTLQPLWERTFGERLVVSCDTAGSTSDGERIYIGSRDGLLSAFDLLSGDLCWQISLGCNLQRSRPLVANGLVYAASFEAGLFAVRALDGVLQFHFTGHPDGCWSPPCLLGHLIALHSGPTLFLIDPTTGEQRDELAIGYHAYTALVPFQNDLLVGGGDPPNDTYLFRIALHPADQKARENGTWVFHPPTSTACYRLSTSETVDAIQSDAHSLGGSRKEAMRPLGTGQWEWTGTIPGRVKEGQWTAITTLYDSTGESRVITTVVDFSTGRALPAQVQIPNIPQPVQVGITESGPAVIEAVLRRYGRQVQPNEIAAMANYIIEAHHLDPHDKWRSGAVRILHSSNPHRLPEMEGIDYGDVLQSEKRPGTILR
jgi:outer membrane protein assembly factor BamB